MQSDLPNQLAQFANQVDHWFIKRLARFDADMRAPMLYALEGGKKLRGFLVHQSGGIFDLPIDMLMPAIGAIEAMHAYSLIHDDLPAMDDDDLRRGKPSLHKQYDEAIAILTGDALQSLAFELLGDLRADFDAPLILELSQNLAQASGAQGMVLGQLMDISADNTRTAFNLDQIKTLQAHKTGALIQWSASAGAILAQKDDAPLRHYGQHLGLAYQIWDDVLDVIGTVNQTGKAVRKDADQGKATFVSHLGLDGAKLAADQQVKDAISAVKDYGQKADILRMVAQFCIARQS